MVFRVYVVLLLIPMSLLHYHVHAEGISSRCESSATYMGDTGSVTCYFSVDLKQSSKSFRLYRYSMDPTNIRTRDELIVLECYWLTVGDMQCEPPAPGYEFNGTVSDQVRVSIPKVSPDFQGKYECRAEPSYPRDIKDCVFLIKSSPEPTGGQTGVAESEEDSSKTVWIAVGVVVAILLAAVAIVLVVFWKRVKDRLAFCGRQTTKDRSPPEQTPGETGTPLLAFHAKEQSTVTGLPEGQKSKAELERKTVETKMAEAELERTKAMAIERARLEEERKQLERRQTQVENEKLAVEKQKAEAELERKTAETKMAETELEKTKAMARLEEERKQLERRQAQVENEKLAVEKQKAEAELERKTAKIKMAETELERTKAMARLEEERKQLDRRQAQVDKERLAVENQKAEREKEKERQRAQAETERKTVEKMKAETELKKKAAEKERVSAELERKALEEERVRLEKERSKNEERLEAIRRQVQAAGSYRILLVGKTGSGKSSTGNTILGETKFHASGRLQSVTEKCKLKRGQCLGRTVKIMDTPSLGNTDDSDEKVIKEIARGVEQMSRGFHVVLWVVRCDMRYTSEDTYCYKVIKTLLGEDVTKHMIVLLTGADGVFQESNYEELTKVVAITVSKITLATPMMDDCKWRHVPFSNSADAETNAAQLEYLFSTIETLLAQNGRIIYRPTLNVTEAIRQ